jgi:hypothetical protein
MEAYIFSLSLNQHLSLLIAFIAPRFPSQLIAKIALSYHNQVNLDFHCFEEYMKKAFPSTNK